MDPAPGGWLRGTEARFFESGMPAAESGVGQDYNEVCRKHLSEDKAMSQILSRFPELNSLSADEKYQLAAELEEAVVKEIESSEVPPWVVKELERRAAAYDADPTQASDWSEVKARLLERIKHVPTEAQH